MTAAGDEKKSNDDEPDPVVIEQIAEAVIHSGISFSEFARWLRRPFRPPLCYHIMRKYREGERKMSNGFQGAFTNPQS